MATYDYYMKHMGILIVVHVYTVHVCVCVSKVHMKVLK